MTKPANGAVNNGTGDAWLVELLIGHKITPVRPLSVPEGVELKAMGTRGEDLTERQCLGTILSQLEDSMYVCGVSRHG